MHSAFPTAMSQHFQYRRSEVHFNSLKACNISTCVSYESLNNAFRPMFTVKKVVLILSSMQY